MNHSIIPFLCSFLLLSASSASAFNVTKILSQYPDYSNFNDLLSKTGLASEINSKSTITLLAIPNGAIGDLTSKSNDVVKSILTTHVVLDYYDTMKLQKLKDKTTKLTTMFQESGKASNDQGFLNVTAKDNTFVFGSAVKDAQRDSRLEKSVMNQPYNISILGISQPIVTPGLDSALAPSSAPPPKANTPKSSPPKAESPAQEEAEAPSDEQESKAPSPSKNADSPSGDSPTADAQSPSSSSAGKLKVSFGFFVVLTSMVAAS
ncbi:fasciclin-like arabinogalactan protein 3 [Solanum dulcamara]|uniref:fasciclin-like arabinogalactan protein 3 n=1 Tax=Solanum dulcamara TaxID=45834 RepID=UPI002486675E|nr:fasciclin-like arabinogalactan protein 3 [Solanum dulcamara]